MASGARSASEAEADARFVFEPRPGEALRAKVSLAASLVLARSPGFETRPDVDVWLPELLWRTHCFARASAPLMRAALERAEELGRTDRVAWGLREYLSEHIAEEAEHGEWMLEDLEVLGRKRAAVLARVPPLTIARGVGAQYYWVQHYHPVAVLAYIALLEHTVLPLQVLEPLAKGSKLPARAFRSLFEHAKLDPVHTERVYTLLDALPLTPGQKQVLGVNAFETASVLDQSLQEVFAHAPAARAPRRARTKRIEADVAAPRAEPRAQTRLDARTPRRTKLPALQA